MIDKRVYVLGSFFDMKKEKNVVDEKEIIDILEEKKIIHDYREICLSDMNDVCNSLEYVLADNIDQLNDSEKHSTLELNMNFCNISKSCFII